eukprot:1948413-Prymnesium_polylepis.1
MGVNTSMSEHIQAASIDKAGPVRTYPQTYPDMDMSPGAGYPDDPHARASTSKHKKAMNIVQTAAD